MPIYTDNLHNRKGLPQPIPRGSVPDFFGTHCAPSNLKKAKCPILGSVYAHKKIIDALVCVFGDIEKAGKAPLVDMSDYGGTYNCRQVRSGGAWSPHAWAIGIDLNVHHHANKVGKDVKLAASNYKCSRDAIAPSLAELAPFFYRWGFSWGGIWTSTCDPMHFEATEVTLHILHGTSVPNLKLWQERMQEIGPVTMVTNTPSKVKLIDHATGKIIGVVDGEVADWLAKDGACRIATNKSGERTGDHRTDQGKIYMVRG